MILMHVYPLQFQGLAVEQETSVGIESNISDTGEPLSASKAISRIPVVVSYTSVTWPSTLTVVSTLYRYGSVVLHRCGACSDRVCLQSLVSFGLKVMVAMVVLPTSCPSASYGGLAYLMSLSIQESLLYLAGCCFQRVVVYLSIDVDGG